MSTKREVDKLKKNRKCAQRSETIILPETEDVLRGTGVGPDYNSNY